MRNNDGATTNKASSINLERKNNKFSALSHQRDSWNSQSNLSALFDGSTYRPDFMAAILCFLMTLVLISGVKKSVKFNNYLNLLNFSVFLFIIIAVLPLLSIKYWKTDFYNNNSTTNNYPSRSKNVQTSSHTYRVPYQRGLINRWESENTYFDRRFDRNLVKRSSSMLLSKTNEMNNKKNYRRSDRRLEKEKQNKLKTETSLRTQFHNLVHFINKRFKRSLVHDEDNRKKSDHEHESAMAGFGDDDDEDEEPSIVTAGK